MLQLPCTSICWVGMSLWACHGVLWGCIRCLQARHLSWLTPECSVQIGEISSGAFSPCLKKNIAMGYVGKGHGKAGTKLKVCPVDRCCSA